MRRTLEWNWLDRAGLFIAPFFLAWVGMKLGKPDGEVTGYVMMGAGFACGIGITNGVTYGVRAMKLLWEREDEVN